VLSASENLYQPRINQVIDYVQANPTADCSLEALAEIAHFSPFHFHRIFKMFTGETLNRFVNRVRVAWAVTLLRSNPSMNILDAALASGYASASGFSRAFRKQYGMAPRQWDRQTPLQERKIGQVADDQPTYTVEDLCDGAPFPVEVRSLPAQRLAYVRIYDSYRSWDQVIAGYERIISWFQAQGGELMQANVYGMSQDDPDITPQEKCRFDWCVEIPEDWAMPDDISVREFPACRIAAVHTLGSIDVLEQAWNYLWRCWLPRSRYQPANLPALEIYCRLPTDIGWETYDMWCAVPIVDL